MTAFAADALLLMRRRYDPVRLRRPLPQLFTAVGLRAELLVRVARKKDGWVVPAVGSFRHVDYWR